MQTGRAKTIWIIYQSIDKTICNKALDTQSLILLLRFKKKICKYHFNAKFNNVFNYINNVYIKIIWD